MKLSRKKIGGLFAAVALVLVSVVAGFSQQGRPPGPPHGGGGGFHGGPGHRGGGIPFARELDLTDEQKAQIEKLTQSFEENTKSLHEQMRALHDSETDPLAGGTFDESAVRKAAQARAGIQVELEVAHARLMSQIFGVLTAEQKAKLAERRQQFEQRRKEHDERRPEATGLE